MGPRHNSISEQTNGSIGTACSANRGLTGNAHLNKMNLPYASKYPGGGGDTGGGLGGGGLAGGGLEGGLGGGLVGGRGGGGLGGGGRKTYSGKVFLWHQQIKYSRS